MNSERAALENQVFFTLDFGVLACQNRPFISPTESHGGVSLTPYHSKKVTPISPAMEHAVLNEDIVGFLWAWVKNGKLI